MKVFLGLGANIPGPWGAPSATIARALEELRQSGVRVVCASRVFSTAPLGPGLQHRYSNAVLEVATALAPAALLRLLKRIERRAGRRLAARSRAPRPLDIDILAYGAARIGWPARRRLRGGLILPHPEMHVRAFVLMPLLDVAPDWRHPVLGVGARALLARLSRSKVADIRQSLDFQRSACDKLRERVAPPADGVPGAFSRPHDR